MIRVFLGLGPDGVEIGASSDGEDTLAVARLLLVEAVEKLSRSEERIGRAILASEERMGGAYRCEA